MEKEYILTLDSGTTSVRSVIVNKKGELIAQHSLRFTQYYPNSGWVEHDPMEILNSQKTTIYTAKKNANIKSYNIAAVGITNQRETVVAWDKETGQPIYNAIVWQDRRTSEFCDQLINDGKEEFFNKKTGLTINPYFSGTKIKWLIENVPEAKKLIEKNRLLVGTIDTWLLWNLTNGKVFATDVSNASRTLLFNINTMEWDQEILDLFNIPKNILPEVKSSSEVYGHIDPKVFSPKSDAIIPISGIAGDQQSSLFGQLCINEGDVKNTYGTGCFALVNTGEKPIFSKNKLLTTVAWQLGNNKPIYAIEGSVFLAGAAIDWLDESLRIIYDPKQTDFYSKLAQKNKQRIYIVPSFTGLGAPYWDSYSRGAIFGLERSTRREHIVNAMVESIAYQSNDLLMAMEKDIGKKITKLKVDGGVCNNNYLMQHQASISDLTIDKPENLEVTAMGASYLAGLAVGFWKSIEELKQVAKIEKVYKSEIDENERAKLLKGWKVAVERTFNWTKEIE